MVICGTGDHHTQLESNINYDYPDLKVRVLDWWAMTPGIMTSSTKDSPVLPSYIHANIGETSCILAARP
jgi:hypothetical protein